MPVVKVQPHAATQDVPLELMSQSEFRRRFATDEACEEHLARLRWPLGFICPRCHNGGYYWLEFRRVYQCTSCRHQVSLTAGTVMHSSKVPLAKWFWAIYLWVTSPGGWSAKALAAELEVSYATAWFLLHRVRAAVGPGGAGPQLLGGAEVGASFSPDSAVAQGDEPPEPGPTMAQASADATLASEPGCLELPSLRERLSELCRRARIGWNAKGVFDLLASACLRGGSGGRPSPLALAR